MAIVSHAKGYLFIMAPRTACTAIGYHLIQAYDGEWLPREDVRSPDGSLVIEKKHCTLAQLIGTGILDLSVRSSLFVFGTVRNPFDSLVSLYMKLTTQYIKHWDKRDRWIYSYPGLVKDMQYLRDHSFSEWIVMKYGDHSGDELTWGKHIEGLDFVMRFERLQEDFDHVMRQLGIDGETRIPMLNKTKGRTGEYRRYYTPKARRTVERAFRADLDQFGYSF